MSPAVPLIAAFVLAAGCSPGGADPTARTNTGLSESARSGRQVFTRDSQPACGSCHTLKHAGTTATIGPDLDELRPGPERTRKAVREGIGIMPPQAGVLSDDQIRAVSDYVAEVAGR